MKHRLSILALAGLLVLSAGTPGPVRLPLDPPPELRAFVEGNAEFALDLYARLSRTPGNLFCSPYSLSSALALTQTGARGVTEAQISRAAHFSDSQSELQAGFARLRAELARVGKARNVELTTATGLWAQKDYGFEKDFLELTRRSHDATVEFVDFAGSPTSASRQIAAWINRQTRGRLAGAMPAGDLTPATRLVIADTIYFKGAWASRFSKGATRDQPFWVSGTASVSALMMRQEQVLLFAEADAVQMLELPYVGRDLSMIILLPKERDGLAALERNLNAARLKAWAGAFQLSKVDLQLPRFKVASALPLRAALESLGMTDAFDADRADFRGMSVRRPLFIHAIEQSSVVEVNEEGTTAASATRVSFGCAKAAEPPRRQLHADHPFVFFIRENHTGMILFLGRVTDPTK